MSIVPNRSQFAQLAAAPDEGPVVMLNLLKFKPGDGQDEFRQYGDSAKKMVEARGGKLLWQGRPQQTLIGDEDVDAWDYVALVEYPSRKTFIEMVTNADYMKAHEHREAGVDRTVLLACRAVEF